MRKRVVLAAALGLVSAYAWADVFSSTAPYAGQIQPAGLMSPALSGDDGPDFAYATMPVYSPNAALASYSAVYGLALSFNNGGDTAYSMVPLGVSLTQTVAGSSGGAGGAIWANYVGGNFTTGDGSAIQVVAASNSSSATNYTKGMQFYSFGTQPVQNAIQFLNAQGITAGEFQCVLCFQVHGHGAIATVAYMTDYDVTVGAVTRNEGTTPYGVYWSGETYFTTYEYSGPSFSIGATQSNFNSRLSVSGSSSNNPTIGVEGTGATPATSANLKLQALGIGAVVNASHWGFSGTSPALTACGTTPSLDGTATDGTGVITEGTTATGCVLTFAASYLSTPHCVISSPNAATFTSYTVSTTALTIVNGSASGNKYTYICAQ